MPFGLHMSPLSTRVRDEDGMRTLWLEELRDLSRGFCGALFVALPLHYTEEMWLHARRMPWWSFPMTLLVAYFINVAYQAFEGFKSLPHPQSIWFDAMTSLGIGALASAATMLLAGRYTPDMPFELACRLILMETTIASFGASLAINQLGARGGSREGTQPGNKLHPDLRKVLATALGAVLFAYNIAPTIEPSLISVTIGPWHLLALMLFALVVSALMTYFADFVERTPGTGILDHIGIETVVAYAISLAVSALLLWYFGYLGTHVSAADALSRIIVLGYATTLGGAAGRLII